LFATKGVSTSSVLAPTTRFNFHGPALIRASFDIAGRTVVMVFTSGISRPMGELSELARRKAGAAGLPVRLADGELWLLAVPLYLAAGKSLTHPDVDESIDRLFEQSVLSGEVSLVDIAEVARTLLLANYDLSDEEFAELASFAPSEESRAFAAAVLEALFGPPQAVRSYSDWVRASLLANGVASSAIQPSDLANVLSILVATKRTVPAAQFIDASRAAEEQASLESLI
jgi:hypothetical protein